MSNPVLRHPAILGAVLIGIAVPGTADDGPPLPFAEGSTTLAILPDTQYYSQKYPHHFEAQTRWISEHFRERKIVYALHLGDIVQSDAPAEWEVAQRCLRMLDGKVPYLLTPGNHDYSDDGRASRLSEYFPVRGPEKWPSFGGVQEKDRLDNNYHLFRIGDQDRVALGLEFGPRKETMDWANEVLTRHRNRRAIIVTHGYLFYDNQRYDHHQGRQRASPHGYAGDGADGEELWRRVVRKHPNVMIVICGHVRTGGLGYRTSEGDYGNTVHEMMANYQKMRGGGMGFMRLLEFHPDGKTVQVRTLATSTGEIRKSALEHFSFKLKGATRDHPKPEPPVAVPLRARPIHRYSFDGKGGDQTSIPDRSGRVAGKIIAPDGSARLDGNGHLVIDSSDTAGHAELPAKLVRGRRTVSMEVWVAPTAGSYDWNPVVYFGDRSDAFYYTFRTLQKHRAELIDDRHNEDIQRTIDVKVGKPLHIVMTYDQGEEEKAPEIVSYINGERTGRMTTSIKLSGLDLKQGRIGPFAGVYDELRIYDYTLSAEEVRNNFMLGPENIAVSH